MLTDEDIEVLDIDWFGVDLNGRIAHFTTGVFGGVPDSVHVSRDDLRNLVDYFRDFAPATGHGIRENNWARLSGVNENDLLATQRYLHDFLHMASKGLYSFDAKTSGARPNSYFRVATPASPLLVSAVPANISSILRRTIAYDSTFEAITSIAASSFT